MPLRRYWERQDVRIPYGFAVPATKFRTSSSARAQFAGDTMLRSICRPRLIVEVGSITAPPESWYAETYIHWAGYVDTDPGAIEPEPMSGDPRIVSSAILRPRLVPSQSAPPSPTAPGEYTIFFEGQDAGEQSHGMRKGQSGTDRPYFATVMHVIDETGSLPGPGYPSMNVGIWEGMSILWGTVNP